MKHLQLLTVGELDGVVIEGIAVELANHFGLPCEVLSDSIDPQFAFHGERRQYHSSQILAQMSKFVGPKTWRLLAVTGNDLYIPILTFVFGEAQMGGPSVDRLLLSPAAGILRTAARPRPPPPAPA